MADLKKAYEAIKLLESIGIQPSKEQKRAIREMEENYLKEEVIPLMQTELEPLFKNIRGVVKLDLKYHPDSGIVVKPYQKPIAANVRNEDSTVRTRTRAGSRKFRIQITFPDNTVSCKSPVLETLMDVIRYAGPERVQELGIYIMGDNLVSHTLNKDERYKAGQKEIKPGLYVCTFSSTETKLEQIKKINKDLQLGLRIEKIMF